MVECCERYTCSSLVNHIFQFASYSVVTKCVWAQLYQISKLKPPRDQFSFMTGKAIRKMKIYNFHSMHLCMVQIFRNISKHFWYLTTCRWVVIFSHPSDFTPVCTTELGRIAVHQPHFCKRNVKLLAHSVDDLKSHVDWVNVCSSKMRSQH